MSPERDDYRDDDDREEFASRSIFSAGWFRAVLVLTVLAIVVVISLPYLLNWFEPVDSGARGEASRVTQAGAGRDTTACRCARSGARPRCPGCRAARDQTGATGEPGARSGAEDRDCARRSHPGAEGRRREGKLPRPRPTRLGRPLPEKAPESPRRRKR